jgi:hypothetical protein
MAEDIKKTFIFSDQLTKVNENNKHHLRFRITTDDLSKTSSWSPFYELDGRPVVAVSGKCIDSGDVLNFTWDDANGRPEYDVFIAEGRSVSLRSLTSNVATITTSSPHGFQINDRVTVQGTGAATIDGTGLLVTNVTSTTFTYSKVATNVVSASATAGAGAYLEKRAAESLPSYSSSATMNMYRYHGTSPIHTYSIIQPANVNLVKFIIQVASYEQKISPLIEIYPGTGVYTESFAVS